MTFLFTDIEGSTRRWEENPEAMRSAVARHDELLRNCIEDHGGFIFATGGDGFAAAFGTAADAVATAEAAQAVLVGLDGISVRMGLNTGEAHERDGNYFGPALNRTARLMAAGHGGQVLLSGVTAELLPSLALRNLGEHQLRDLGTPVQVFQLGHDDFPALRTLDQLPTNLPLQLTSFVGRKPEMKELRDVLLEHRLVTLTGVGGVGKTRLAVQLGAEMLPEFPDGVWLCELAAVEDNDTIDEALTSALGVKPAPGTPLRTSVIEFLRAKRLLLLVDNCEHLLGMVDHLIESILRACASVTVLATSREGLGVEGEQLWPLRPLDVETTNTDSPAELSDALSLFFERARAVDPTFRLDADVGEQLALICRRLDGLPLAIELAAARIGPMTPAEIASLLDERFRLLTGGRQRRVERHQTLRAAVDWSYSLLDPVQQRVFDRLGVFSGSFDPVAAQSVACGDELDRLDVVDALGELTRKSMLSVVRIDAQRTRYELLETLRQYALERLPADEVDDVRRRHAVHYAKVASELAPVLLGRDELVARGQVDLELDNFRAAMGWALDRNAVEDQLHAVTIVASLALLVSTLRLSRFGVWAERAVPACRAAPHGLRFAVLGAAAFSATTRGDLSTAKAWCDEAFDLGIPKDCPMRAPAFTARAITIYTTDLLACSRFLHESVEQLEQLGDYYAGVVFRSMAGMFEFLGGQIEEGHRSTAEGLARAREHGNPTALAIALYGYAMVRWQDDPEEAKGAIEESLAFAESGASDVVYADSLELLSRIQRESGDLDRALDSMNRSIQESISNGNRQSFLSHGWYLVEILGLSGIEPAVAAVLDGYTSAGPEADLMPAVLGRERQIHDKAVNAVRSALAPDEFEDLFARGAAMSYEDSANYVAAELQRILRGLPEE